MALHQPLSLARPSFARRGVGLAPLLALTLLLGLVPGLAGAAPRVAVVAAAAAAQEGEIVEIGIVDFAFEPETVEVPAGTTIVWTNQGEVPHTVTDVEGRFDSGSLDPGASFTLTFADPGTYEYFCDIHQRMQGTIVVTEAADDGGEDAAAENRETPAAEDEEATPDAGEADGADADDADADADADEGGDGDAAAGGDVRDLAPVDVPRLSHIHAGTCDELGIVVYALTDPRSYRIEPAGDGEGAAGPAEMIVGTAEVPLADLFNEPFSVHVHQDVANKQIYLACADVGGRPADTWTEADGLALEAVEQAESGWSGFASLRPSADGGTLVNIFLAQAPAGEEATEEDEEATPTPPPGTTYTSPSFGYTIFYGPTWEVTEDVTRGNSDRFVLYNETSFVTFTSVEGYDGDPARCVEDFVGTLTADPSVSNLELAEEGGSDSTGAFAVYDHDYRFPDRTEAYTLFVGCIPLVEGESVLAVVQNVPTDEFAAQSEAREGLLRGLTLPQ
jgi:plastocyanin